MARYKLPGVVFTDQSGNVVEDGTCSVYLASTSTAAKVYIASSGGSSVGSVTSDSAGKCTFYVDSADYNTNQKFKIILSKTDFTSQPYNDIVIFPETEWVYYASASATDQGVDGNENSIADLLAEIGTSTLSTIVCKPGTYTFSTTADWSAYTNITLKVQAGADFAIATGVTITAGMNAEVGPYKWLSLTGTGKWTWGTNTGTYTIYPQWWGVIADGSTDIYTASQAAADSLVAGQTFKFPPGDYALKTDSQGILVTTSGVTIEGTMGTNIIPMGTTGSNSAQSGIHIGNPTAAAAPAYGTAASIVSNGAFTTDTTGWTAVASTLGVTGGGESGNALEITRVSGSEQYAHQALTTVAGTYYTLTAYVKDGDFSGGAFYVGIFDQNTTEITRVVGLSRPANWNEYRVLFKARSASTTVRLVKDNATAGTLEFDTVRCYPLTSNVIIRDFNIKDAELDSGAFSLWATYCNNIVIENISCGEVGFGVTLGNDGDCDVWNASLNNMFSTGDLERSGGDGTQLGMFRVFSGNVSNVNINNQNVDNDGGTLFVIHDSDDVHMSNINLKSPNIAGAPTLGCFESTRIRNCTLNGFTFEGGDLGIVANFGGGSGTGEYARYNTFSNGTILNTTTSALSVYGSNSKYINITTVPKSGDDLTLNTTAGDNDFDHNDFTGATLTDATTGVLQSWNMNHGINEGKIIAHVNATSIQRVYSRTYTDVVTLTAAQVNALETTPIQLAAAGGANTWLEFLGATISYNYTTTAFTDTGADNDFVIRYDGGAGTDLSAAIQATGFIDQANDEIRFVPASAWTVADDVTTVVNKKIELHNPGTGTDDGGTSTLIVSTTYRIYDMGL